MQRCILPHLYESDRRLLTYYTSNERMSRDIVSRDQVVWYSNIWKQNENNSPPDTSKKKRERENYRKISHKTMTQTIPGASKFSRSLLNQLPSNNLGHCASAFHCFCFRGYFLTWSCNKTFLEYPDLKFQDLSFDDSVLMEFVGRNIWTRIWFSSIGKQFKDMCYAWIKNSIICNFWTFWPVIQLIITELSTKISRSAVFKKGCLSDFEKMTYNNRVMDQNIQKCCICLMHSRYP